MNDLKFTNAGDYMRSIQKRIGFACKYLHYNQNQKPKLLEEIQRPYTEKCTTVAWLNRQTKDVAEQRLWDIMVHNAAAAKRLVEYVGSLPPELRMVRLGSNQLPCATEPSWRYFGLVLTWWRTEKKPIGKSVTQPDAWMLDSQCIPDSSRYLRVTIQKSSKGA